METYVGTTILEAQPMTRGDYNNHRGWTIPKDENPSDEGYLVKYIGGYISWSPKEVFEVMYRKNGNLDFGAAVLLMKRGLKLARRGWNGSGMFAYYVSGNSYPAQMDAVKGLFEDNLVPYRPYLALKTAQGDVATWSPSTSDALAEDWEIVN